MILGESSIGGEKMMYEHFVVSFGYPRDGEDEFVRERV